MARTFHAEGRQITNFLRVILICGGSYIYFKIPDLHWGFLFGIIIVATIIAEIAGRMWTRWRREQKKVKQQQARKLKTARQKQTVTKTTKNEANER